MPFGQELTFATKATSPPRLPPNLPANNISYYKKAKKLNLLLIFISALLPFSALFIKKDLKEIETFWEGVKREALNMEEERT